MDEFHKDALKYHNSLQPKRSKIVEEKHEDKIQDEEVHKTSPLTKLLPSSQLAEVNLSDEFDSSSDINELEGKLKCSESAETFSAESTLKVHLDIKHDINDSLSILEVDENRNVEDRCSS